MVCFVVDTEVQSSGYVTAVEENCMGESVNCMGESVIGGNDRSTEESKDGYDTSTKQRMENATAPTHAALHVDNELLDDIRCEEKCTDDMFDRWKQGACCIDACWLLIRTYIFLNISIIHFCYIRGNPLFDVKSQKQNTKAVVIEAGAISNILYPK